MSTWTHIAGTVRINSISEIDGDIMQKIKDYLGEVVDFNSPEEVWDKSTMPQGSEGGIKYILSEDPRQVSFCADLRDYPSDSDYHSERTVEAIITWFEEFLKNFWIRQAVIQINVEYGDEVILFTYSDAEYVTHIHKIVFSRRQQLFASKKDPSINMKISI